jgi:hypothetical protein
LTGVPEEKRRIGRPSSRGEGNIKMDLQQIAYVDMDWIHFVQDRYQLWVTEQLIS